MQNKMSQKCNIFIFLFLLSNNINGQLVSPCPRLFRYEENTLEADRWYGQLIVYYHSDLYGVWIRLHFDRPVIQVGNWFGEVQVNSNIEFVLKKPSLVLKANKTEKVRIMVVYNNTEQPPQLTGFLLNARTLCPEKESQNTNLDFEELWGPDGPKAVAVFPSLLSVNRLSSDNCGQTEPSISPLISQGEYALPGESPWHAALFRYHTVESTYICGGTLVSKNHVITAAHCVTTSLHSTTPHKPEDIGVYLGKTNLRLIDEGTQFRIVSKIFVHPEFNPKAYFNDIAILKLSEPAEITKNVRICCLWEGDTDVNLIVGKIGTVVGWGMDETNSFPLKLLKTMLPVATLIDCIYYQPDFFKQNRIEKIFCAGFLEGTSTCNGDSGGGLIFLRNNRKVLRGIVSNKIASNFTDCDKSSYTIFTDVAKYLPWISDILLKL